MIQMRKHTNVLQFSLLVVNWILIFSLICLLIYNADDDTYEPLKPLQFLPYNKASNFYVQIGKNTGYTVHPEEISAEHFVLWMTKMNYLNTLNSPDVIDKMNQIMIRAANHF